MAEPSKKSAGIEAALELFFGKQRRENIRANICVECKGPAVTFNDKPSREEYLISGLCQSCQDEVFVDG